MKPYLIFLFLIKFITASATTPIVLWHGMGDTCCFSFSLGGFKQFLEEQIPGVYVYSIRIGNSTVEDFESGYFMSPNKQVKLVCDTLAADPNLRNGFNAIGFSQGGQFMRALVQRCGGQLKIKNLISLGGQHQGVYGLPHCGAISRPTCDYLRQALNIAAYTNWVQETLVQATYWHDPLNEKKYQLKSQFLADINNERAINKKYVKNLGKLQHFVLVKFDADSIVQPRETEWFGFYAPGQSKKLQTLEKSDLYLKDRLGLKAMKDQGQLVFLSSPGDHLRFSEEWFIQNIITPYLN